MSIVLSTPNVFTTTVRSVIDKARAIVNDADAEGYRDEDAVYLGWINDALNAAVMLEPTLFVESSTHSCFPGHFQTLANSRAVALVDLPGLVKADAGALTAFAPGWQQMAHDVPVNWMPVPGNPRAFYTYPPAEEGALIDTVIVRAPAPIVSDEDVLPIPENYEPAIVDYVVFRTQSKDDEHVLSQRAAGSFQLYVQGLKGAAQ